MINIKVDPNVPDGKLFIFNEKDMQGHIGIASEPVRWAMIDARTRWQRIKDWFKRLVK